LEEARILTGIQVENEEDALAAAHRLVEMGAGAALVKGGHGSGHEVVDVFWDGSAERVWRRPRIRTTNTHGTGCTLSAAIAAGLARGDSLEGSVDRALDFVATAIREAPGLGSGHGPLSHFVKPALLPHL
jgi:hydroxymethylpyrimidine/phosphomethylpyrimidine kinase